MYNKLYEQSRHVSGLNLLKIYNETNLKIDKYAESKITQLMSEGKFSWTVFYKACPSIDYDKLFKEFYQSPYDKSIVDRLREKFPAPDFRIHAKRVHYTTHDFFNPNSADVDYYEVSVNWGEQDCKCVIL